MRLDPSGRGGPTRGQARGPRWRSTGHGWSVPAAVTLSPEQRILEAAVRLPPGGAVTGWAALRLLGAEHAGRRGARVVRDALRLARERTWSPLETRVGLVGLLDAGLPHPLVNVPVFTPGGRLLGYPDLLDPATGLVGEVDGAVHRSARRHAFDVRREDLMRRAGLEVFRVTGSDLARRDLLSARMRAAADRAATTRARHWTLDPPADWDPGLSLDARLALRDALRTTDT